MFSHYVGEVYRESLYNLNNDIKVHTYDRYIQAYTRKDTATLNSRINMQKT